MAEWDEVQQEKRMKRIRQGGLLLALLLLAGLAFYFYSRYQYKKNVRLLLQEIAALDELIRLPRRGLERTFNAETPNEDEWFVFYSAEFEQTADATKLMTLPGERVIAEKINEVELHHARKTYEVFTALQEELAPPVSTDALLLDYTALIATAKGTLARLLKQYPRAAADKESALYAIRFALQSHQDALKNLQRAANAVLGPDAARERLTSWRLALYAGKKAYERIETGL